MYHVVLWSTQTITQKQTILLKVFVRFLGDKPMERKNRKAIINTIFTHESNNWNKVTCERKINSLTVIQVQVYRPMVMEPHIDEGSLILWSSSPNTKKKQKKTKKKPKNKDLHVNRPCKNPISKKILKPKVSKIKGIYLESNE